MRAGETSITEPAFAAAHRHSRRYSPRHYAATWRTRRSNSPAFSRPDGTIRTRSPGGVLCFQHFAIVVSDMAAAYGTAVGTRRVGQRSRPMGRNCCPLHRAASPHYKFRDPDGHPLELIAFARDAVPARWQTPSTAECLGIDHSAISVAGTERSVNFYERLGLPRTGGSLNRGPEQDKLDGVAEAVVEVTALAPPRSATPHIELLCYRDHAGREPAFHEINDIAATQLVLDVGNDEMLASLCAQNPDAVVSAPVRFANGIQRALMRDPDGHLLCLEAPR